MKKIQFLLWILLTLFISASKLLGQCYQCEYLYASDPQTPWYQKQLAIEDVTMVAKPVGKFYQVDLYMHYKVSPLDYANDWDTLEVVHYFKLPSSLAITDSWLWVNDTIMKAQILERYDAFNIYEGIVNRRKDPSVLYKNGVDQYEYRIFPMPGNKSRKVKLSFMMATNGFDEITLPTSIFKFSSPKPKVKMIVYDKDTDKQPRLGGNITFVKRSDPNLGSYHYAEIEPSNYSDVSGHAKSISFKLEQEKKDVEMFTSSSPVDAERGLFQLVVNPSEILGADTLDEKKYIFVIDYHSIATYYSKTTILEALKNQIQRVVKPRDEFRIMYNQLTVKEVSNDWMKLSEVNLDDIINKINLGNNSLLSSLLYEAYDYLKTEETGSLFLLSSDNTKVLPSSAQALKNELTDAIGVLKPTFILDFANYYKHGQYTYFLDKYFYGNELFYKTLTSNTRGAYESLELDNGNADLNETLNLLSGKIRQNKFDFIDYDIKSVGGLCFDIQAVENGARSILTGSFRGRAPFRLELVALYKDSLILKEVELDVVSENNLYLPYKQIHAMSKIYNIEGSTNTEIEREDIVRLSLENRVLSRYTAFLALEPGLQEPCFDCEDESDNTVSVDDQDLNQKVLTAAPNPFRNVLTLQLKGVDNASDIEKTELIDLTGRVTTLTLDWSRGENGLVAELDGTDLQSGMYILRITVKGKVYILKIVKA